MCACSLCLNEKRLILYCIVLSQIVLLFLVFHNCLRNPSSRNFSMCNFIPRFTFSCDSLSSPSAAIVVHNDQLGAGIHTVIRKRCLFWTAYVQQSMKHFYNSPESLNCVKYDKSSIVRLSKTIDFRTLYAGDPFNTHFYR